MLADSAAQGLATPGAGALQAPRFLAADSNTPGDPHPRLSQGNSECASSTCRPPKEGSDWAAAGPSLETIAWQHYPAASTLAHLILYLSSQHKPASAPDLTLSHILNMGPFSEVPTSLVNLGPANLAIHARSSC